MGKRQLGIGKAKKKQKTEATAAESTDSSAGTENQLTIELPSDVSDDEYTQLKSLYEKYQTDQNELILNGIIHECDRLIRNSSDSKIPAFFYVIYSQSLLELISFKEASEMRDLIDLSLEKADIGLETHPEDASLFFQKSKVLLNQAMFQLGQLKEGKALNFSQSLLTEALKWYEKAESLSEKHSDYSCYNEQTFELLQLFDEILEIVDNFGKNEYEEESDDEQDEDEVPEVVQLVRESDEFNQWWRDHALKFHEGISKKDTKSALYRAVCLNVGQSYLKEAEEPANIFTTLMYDETYKSSTISGLDVKTAQKIGIELFQKAIKYLRDSWDEEDVQSWVNLSESLISLGNLYDLDSEEQAQSYKEAETILVKANNVTNGKYKDILDNLL